MHRSVNTKSKCKTLKTAFYKYMLLLHIIQMGVTGAFVLLFRKSMCYVL